MHGSLKCGQTKEARSVLISGGVATNRPKRLNVPLRVRRIPRACNADVMARPCIRGSENCRELEASW